jgi:hypothetical protein
MASITSIKREVFLKTKLRNIIFLLFMRSCRVRKNEVFCHWNVFAVLFSFLLKNFCGNFDVKFEFHCHSVILITKVQICKKWTLF